MNEYGALVEKEGKWQTEILGEKIRYHVPLFSSQIPYGLKWDIRWDRDKQV